MSAPQQRKRRPVQSIIIVCVAALMGFCGGWIAAHHSSDSQLDRAIAMSWGEGFENAFYGAHVFLQPHAGQFSVRARVMIGRGNGYYHDCGELGLAATPAEAVARWGTIEWREDGLHIGKGSNHYFLPKAKLQSHR